VASPVSNVRKAGPGDPQPPLRQAEPVETHGSELREWTEAIVIAFILAIVLRTFLVQAYKIPSGSMEPTLAIGDHIMVNKIRYGLRMPDSLFGLTPFASEIPYGHYLVHFAPIRRGDVVVFVFPLDPTKDFIKRVVGISGDTVQVKNGQVFLNGAPMPDPHAHFEVAPAERSQFSVRDNYPATTVPAGQFFMMGDNRDRSYDSRFWGFVKLDQVEGRAMFIYWSWGADSQSFLGIRWSRFGKAIR